MQHVNPDEALVGALDLKGGTRALEVKSSDDAPEQIVTKALADLTKTVDDRIASIEAKAADAAKLVERLDRIEAKQNRPGTAVDTVEPSVERKAFYHYLRSGDATEYKALGYAAPSTGGVFAPDTTSMSIIERVTEFSPVRSLANVIQFNGSLLQLPRLVDDVVVGEVTETGTRSEDEPTFEMIDVKPFEMSVIVPVTRILLEDSQIGMEAYLQNYLGRRYGEKESGWFINGNGTSQAQGVLVSPEVAERETAGTALVADDLIDHFYSVKAAYRNQGAWLMNSTTLALVRKMKDSTGAYIWEKSLAANQPEHILGRPVYETPHMPDPAAAASPIVFGDFKSGYSIIDRVAFEFDTDTKTAWGSGVVKLLTRRRLGGRVVLGEALSKLTIAAA